MSDCHCALLEICFILVPLETACDVILIRFGPWKSQEGNSHRNGQCPDDNAHDDPTSSVVRRGRIQRPGHCPVSVDADGPEEEDGAVGVDEEQRASQPAHEVCVNPVTMPAVIPNPKGKCTDEKEISDGQICHVDADFTHGLGLAKASQDKQHVEVGNEAQDEDDAICNWEQDVTKLRLEEE